MGIGFGRAEDCCVAPVLFCLLNVNRELIALCSVVVSDDDGGKESQGRMTTKIIYNFQHKTNNIKQ